MKSGIGRIDLGSEQPKIQPTQFASGFKSTTHTSPTLLKSSTPPVITLFYFIPIEKSAHPTKHPFSTCAFITRPTTAVQDTVIYSNNNKKDERLLSLYTWQLCV